MKQFLLLIWMCLIVQLSSTSGLHVSDPTTWLNETVYESDISWSFLEDAESEFYNPYQQVFTMNFLLHKLSHILFYSVLVFLFYINFKKSKPFALFALCLFAFSDEIHQHFVVGRSGRALDVLLDVVAGALFLGFYHLKTVKTKKNNDKMV